MPQAARKDQRMLIGTVGRDAALHDAVLERDEFVFLLILRLALLLLYRIDQVAGAVTVAMQPVEM
jgi:hypothetical protein